MSSSEEKEKEKEKVKEKEKEKKKKKKKKQKEAKKNKSAEQIKLSKSTEVPCSNFFLNIGHKAKLNQIGSATILFISTLRPHTEN